MAIYIFGSVLFFVMRLVGVFLSPGSIDGCKNVFYSFFACLIIAFLWPLFLILCVGILIDNLRK